MSLSEGDLSNAKEDMDEHLAYSYMILQMTTDSDKTDELLYNYITTFTRFSGIQLPPYIVKSLFQIQLIAAETSSGSFGRFMENMSKKMNDREVRSDPVRFYRNLGKNICHLGTALRTMAAVLNSGRDQKIKPEEAGDSSADDDVDDCCAPEEAVLDNKQETALGTSKPPNVPKKKALPVKVSKRRI